MAFFRDKSSSYFSLSLDPAGHRKARVFRVTDWQAAFALRSLPLLFLFSLLSLLLTILLSLGIALGGTDPSSNPFSVVAICALALVAGATAIFEMGWFLWVYRQPDALLSEAERHRLKSPSILRRPSILAYATFLLALLTPVVGLTVIPLEPNGSGTDGAAGALALASLVAATVILGFLAARRILNLLGARQSDGGRDA